MSWNVEYTDEFGEWFDTLAEREQNRMVAGVELLEVHGPSLDHPHSSGIVGSRHDHMRELRIQIGGKPFRVFYAFDPRRNAILLIGGDKTGDKRFYERMIPIADDLYDEHLDQIRREGLKQ